MASGLAQQIPEADRQPPGRPPAPRGPLAQVSTLCRRYLAVIASDRSYLAVLAIMPIVIGALLRAVPSPEGLAGKPGTNGDVQSLLLVLVIGACFIGAANSVRELVKERAIYARERAAGLSSGTYLFSKIIVLGVISGLQALLLVLLGLAGRQMPAHGSLIKSLPLAEIALAIVVLSLASMALGLLVSSIVSTSEKAMPLLVMLAIAQVILSGGVLPLNGKVGLNQLSWIAPGPVGLRGDRIHGQAERDITPGRRAARPAVGSQAGHLADGHGADGAAGPDLHTRHLAAPGRAQPRPQTPLSRSRSGAAPRPGETIVR